MSKTMTKLALSLAVLASSAQAYPHDGPKGAGADWQGMPTVGKAVYFITNAKDNAVVALPIGKDGMLSIGSTTPTGGAGGISINAATMKPDVPDPLASQSSLTIVGHHIFAVNAGSNTLTMLAISREDPTCLTVIGKPVLIPGDFPNTVAASEKNKLVCVGTTGAKAGVSCASFSRQGLGQMDDLRPFELGQQTPPLTPLNTVSQTFFSKDESILFTTVKGNPAVNNTGFISAFNVEKNNNGHGSLSRQDIRSAPNGTAVLFGSVPIPDSDDALFVTDASFGAVILDVSKSDMATTAAKQTIAGQKATCWSTISRKTKSAYVADAAVNRVVEMSLTDAKIIKTLDLFANGDPGLIDLIAAGNFVYALAPGNVTSGTAVTVLDISGGQGSMKQVQHFKLPELTGNTAMGMVALMW